jgi:hypothetical protein
VMLYFPFIRNVWFRPAECHRKQQGGGNYQHSAHQGKEHFDIYIYLPLNQTTDGGIGIWVALKNKK